MRAMTVVVTGNCEGCRYTECTEVCPVSCFHGDARMLYVDPDLCIDCGACIPVCPVTAIVDERDLSPADRVWAERNAERASVLPVVSRREAPLPTADARRASLSR